MDRNERHIRVLHLGRTDYAQCWDRQHSMLSMRLEGTIPDTVLLTEHDHVYTIGTSGSDSHLLASRDELSERGLRVYSTDRGGDITYHGPGQLVGYPILDLHSYYLDLHRYLRDIEEVVIRTLSEFGLPGERLPEYTGVWVGGEKICAIGIKTNRWVTMHGFALNVNTDLSYYRRIIPCGIADRGVTSMQKLLGRRVRLEEVACRSAEKFADVFGATVSQDTAWESLSVTGEQDGHGFT